MFGAGYLEMLARADDRRSCSAIRDAIRLGARPALVAKGVSFGRLTAPADGIWDTCKVEGLPPPQPALD